MGKGGEDGQPQGGLMCIGVFVVATTGVRHSADRKGQR